MNTEKQLHACEITTKGATYKLLCQRDLTVLSSWLNLRQRKRRRNSLVCLIEWGISCSTFIFDTTFLCSYFRRDGWKQMLNYSFNELAVSPTFSLVVSGFEYERAFLLCLFLGHPLFRCAQSGKRERRMEPARRKKERCLCERDFWESTEQASPGVIDHSWEVKKWGKP